MTIAKHASVSKTNAGTQYLTEPGVVLIAATQTHLDGVQGFLDGFERDLGFDSYLKDDKIDSGAQLVKFAGQLCYLSLGENRTKNKDVKKYLDNIKQSGHGSVLEHVNLTFLFYGITRSQTHEIVRHRAGFAFSQVSQRYVDGSVLRFVERPEYVGDLQLHNMFVDRIDYARSAYDSIAGRLMELQAGGSEILSGEVKRDLRKKVNQAARSCLPNETEAPIVVTANARGWRHFFEMRAAASAETEVRRTAYRAFQVAQMWEPEIFGDYEPDQLPDGTMAVKTKWRKV